MMRGKRLDEGRAAVAALIQAGDVGPEAVRDLQRLVLRREIVGREMADALFDLEATGRAAGQDWTTFFVEAITAHVVWETRPTGIVDSAKGTWLLEQVDRVGTLNGTAALVNVMAEAHRVPAWLLAAARSRAARAMAQQAAA